jgi:4-amino-4-deoxy-L-arabinose transferase-like glycosyltransferase
VFQDSLIRNPTFKKYIALALIVLIALPILFYNLGEQRLKFGDESLHILVTKEMMASGNWTEPTFRFEPYFSKPPFKMWLTMALLSVTPDTLFWFRFPDAVLTLASLILLFFISQRFIPNPFVPVLAAFLLLLNKVFVFHGARTAVQDSMVMFSTMLCLYLFIILKERKDREPYQRQLKLAVLIGLVSSMAMMSKYIAGFYGFLVGLPFLFISDPKKFFSKYKLELGCSLAVAIAPISLWLGYLLSTQSTQLLNSLNLEIYQRLFGEGVHSVGNHGFYLNALLVEGYWLPPVLISAFFLCLIFKICKDRSLGLLLLCWGVLPIVLFSALNSYLIRYINPSLPALALGISLMIFESFGFLFQKAKGRDIKVKTVSICVALGLFIVLVRLILPPAQTQLARLANPTPHFQIDRLAQQIRRYASTNPESTEILFIDVTNSESPDFGPGFPDYNRVYLMDMFSLFRFSKLNKMDSNTIRSEDDFLMASSCILDKIQNRTKGKMCASFESGFDRAIAQVDRNRHVLVCLKNCDGLSDFVACDKLTNEFKGSRCEDQQVLRKPNNRMTFVKNPSLTAR